MKRVKIKRKIRRPSVISKIRKYVPDAIITGRLGKLPTPISKAVKRV